MDLSNKWIDIGVNLTNKRFKHDINQVLSKARENGLAGLIITGTNLTTSQAAFQMTQEYSQLLPLYSTAGCHPHDAAGFKNDDLDLLKQLLQQQSVVAVGECGLDYNRNFSPQAEQRRVFEQQLQLAVETKKPVFLHERDAFEDQVALLKGYMPALSAAVIHCFTGSEDELVSYLELGCYIGITGWICDERRGVHLKEAVTLIPEDKLMLETDAPYLTPRDLKPKPKGGRNEPSFLPHIGHCVAECRGVSPKTLAEQTFRNACRFFDLKFTESAT